MAVIGRHHGGNVRDLGRESGRTPDDILDFSANLNPLGPPPWLRSLVNRNLVEVARYPDPSYAELSGRVAEHEGARPDAIVMGNGTTELIYALPRAAAAPWSTNAVVVEPAYTDYRRASAIAGFSVASAGLLLKGAAVGNTVDTKPPEFLPGTVSFELPTEDLAGQLKSDGSVVWIGRPNNPTGTMPEVEEISRLAASHPASLFVVDESFLAFVDGARSCAELIDSCGGPHRNIVVLRSLTKFYAVPGLRIGYAVCAEGLAEALRAQLPTWSVNALAAKFAIRALDDIEYGDRTRHFVASARDALFAELRSTLSDSGSSLCPTPANYLMLRLAPPLPAATTIRASLLSEGIAVRTCTDFFGLDDRWIRIAVRSPEENAILVTALGRLLHRSPGRSTPVARRDAQLRPRRAKSIMIQGTASNAGKSVLVAAFCRILLREGYRVAPFKSQNMSLNSFVTEDGGEMGRAQVVQAQACRIEPDVRMNPILLKPSSEMGSQIIILGKAAANMEARSYFQAKRQFFDTVKRSYDELAAEYDVVVLEGAGSPGEVNLKSHDIVNMQMAAYAGAPVLITGDIDRGGVFASFIGTMDVLDEWERNLVAGFLINKFRGDPSLLRDALEYTYEYTGRAVLGVVPMIPDLGIPEEDSVSFKEYRGTLVGASGTSEDAVGGAAGRVRIGFIDLPHVSNFTDIDALRIEPDVEISIVRSRPEITARRFDALILPGSKSVAADLEYLRRGGLADAILESAVSGTMVVGICGGFQILGEIIEDPDGVESGPRAVDGLGLLGVRTRMGAGKILSRRTATHGGTDLEVEGYEIHHGRTVLTDAIADFLAGDGEYLGAGGSASGAAAGTGQVSGTFAPVWGTYLHGVFDADQFRRAFIDSLRVAKGASPLGSVQVTYEIESALDRLADVVRDSVDMEKIHRILDTGAKHAGWAPVGAQK